MAAKSLKERLAQVRTILTGKTGDRGLPVYFLEEIEKRTSERPTYVTVYRWVEGITKGGAPTVALRGLAELEQEARDELKSQIKDVGK